MPAVPELFRALVDDAGLFPPELLDMATATDRHRVDQETGSLVLSHRFVCPSVRLTELQAVLTPSDDLRLSVVAPLRHAALVDIATALAADSRVTLVGVEGVLPNMTAAAVTEVAGALAALPGDVPAFLEVSLSDAGAADAAIRALAERGWAAKFRCGGIRAELFPDVGALADGIVSAVAQGVPFKATAGLHHPIGYRDGATGFRHYGFLNVLLAVARAVAGEPTGAVRQVLASTDEPWMVAEAAAIDADMATRVRAAFISYGSCSTSEPLADLIALNLLPTTTSELALVPTHSADGEADRPETMRSTS